MADCYRHPGRQTGVSCSSCGRPICPECMTATPVGMRCPECARQRTQVRNFTAEFPGSPAAPATFTLIVINVIVFVLEMITGSGLMGVGGEMVANYAVWGPGVADGEWWRIITGGFLHANLIHVGLNMFLLYLLGSLVEPLIGTRRFLAVYFVSLIAGSAGALLLTPDSLTVGASGAVFGLMGAGYLVSRDRGMEGAASQIGVLVIINLVFTFAVGGISIGGHIGGLIGGGLAALVILRVPHLGGIDRAQRKILEFGGLLLVGALAFVIALASANAGSPV